MDAVTIMTAVNNLNMVNTLNMLAVQDENSFIVTENGDPGLQDPEEEFQLAQPAGGAAQESHRRTGRSHRGGVRRCAAEPGGYLSQAQARQLHFRRLHRRGQDGAGEAALPKTVRHPGCADPSGICRNKTKLFKET